MVTYVCATIPIRHGRNEHRKWTRIYRVVGSRRQKRIVFCGPSPRPCVLNADVPCRDDLTIRSVYVHRVTESRSNSDIFTKHFCADAIHAFLSNCVTYCDILNETYTNKQAINTMVLSVSRFVVRLHLRASRHRSLLNKDLLNARTTRAVFAV